MNNYNYTVADNTVKAVGFEDTVTVFDISSWKPDMINYYRSLLSHKRDLEYAEAYLNQMFFQIDTSLIDGALINSAVQTLVKCFSNPRNMGRCCLDSTKVFRRYAKAMGEQDLTGYFSKFYDARNTVIAHDQINFRENIIGLTVDTTTGEAEDIAEIIIRTKYLYKQNQETLLRLIKVAKEYVENQIKGLREKLIGEYNEATSKPNLCEVVCENIPIETAL